jgi:hypothetical protein
VSHADARILSVWDQAHNHDSDRDALAEMEHCAQVTGVPLKKCLELLDEAWMTGISGIFARWCKLMARAMEG